VTAGGARLRKRLLALRVALGRRGIYPTEDERRLSRLKNAHAGRRCFVVGNGPSLRLQDLTPLRDEITFVTNFFPLHPQCALICPTYYCVSDSGFFQGTTRGFHPELYRVLTQRARSAAKFFPRRFKAALRRSGQFADQVVYYVGHDLSYETSDGHPVHANVFGETYGGCSVVIDYCLPMAGLMGIRDVYLLGCDCDYGSGDGSDESGDGGRRHFYAPDQHTLPAPPSAWMKRCWGPDGLAFQAYEKTKVTLQAQGCRVYNATAGGRLEVFPRVSYEDVVAR
jgi:hypothetical protein